MTAKLGPIRQTKETATSLVLANAFTLVLALVFHWPLMTLMFPYWAQSVIIGYFNRRRILALENFTTEGFKINDVQPPVNEATKRKTANFFALHYGFFHVGYFAFIYSHLKELTALDWLGVSAAIVPFVANHWYSYRRTVERDQSRCPNIGTLMFTPYLRILPMHLTIIFGGMSAMQGGFPMILFGALKTGADLAMHVVEKAIQAKPEASATSN